MPEQKEGSQEEKSLPEDVSRIRSNYTQLSSPYSMSSSAHLFVLPQPPQTPVLAEVALSRHRPSSPYCPSLVTCPSDQKCPSSEIDEIEYYLDNLRKLFEAGMTSRGSARISRTRSKEYKQELSLGVKDHAEPARAWSECSGIMSTQAHN